MYVGEKGKGLWKKKIKHSDKEKSLHCQKSGNKFHSNLLVVFTIVAF